MYLWQWRRGYGWWRRHGWQVAGLAYLWLIPESVPSGYPENQLIESINLRIAV